MPCGCLETVTFRGRNPAIGEHPRDAFLAGLSWLPSPAGSPILAKAEDENGPGRDGDGRGEGQVVQGAAVGIDGPVVADQERIDPILVNIAVEQLGPPTVARKAKLIVEERVVVETGHNH